MTDSTFAFGLGVGTHNSRGEWLEVFFPHPLLGPSATISAAAADLDPGQALSREQLQQLQAALAEAGEREQAELATRLLQGEQPVVAVLLRLPLMRCPVLWVPIPAAAFGSRLHSVAW